MAAAIPALLAGAVEMAPMIISGITSAAEAVDLFKKYAPSRKTVNSALANINRKSVGKFFKGLTTAKGIGRLFDQGSDLASTIANISQDASSVLTNMERAGLSNDYTQKALSALSTANSTANSMNDMLSTGKQRFKEIVPVVEEQIATIPSLPIEEYVSDIPAITTVKKKKKKAKKNKIIPIVNERSRTYR